jgi:hypothetical protein
VGEKSTVTSESSFTVKIRLGSKGLTLRDEMQTTTVEKRLEEVLEVVGGAVARARVTYLQNSTATVHGDSRSVDTSPLVGKAFILVRRGKRTRVMKTNGKRASRAETKLVLRDYHSFAKFRPIADSMPTRPLSPGEPVPELMRGLEKHMAKGGEMVIQVKSVIFRGAVGGQGRFYVRLASVRKKTGKAKLAAALEGELLVRLDNSQASALRLTGELTVTPNGRLQVYGDGGMTVDIERNWEAAPR